MSTIFTQIASYRDLQLIPTINDLISKAKNPQNLHIIVCWQHGDEQSVEDFLNSDYVLDGAIQDNPTAQGFDTIVLNKNFATIILIDVLFEKTKGACWARNLIQQFYHDETYTLQLDSHHRFVDNWDEVAINMLESLRYKSKKPVLTAYVPSFDPDNDPAGRITSPWKMNFDRFIPEGAVFFMPATIDEWQEIDEPVRARFYSAHFCFADGSFATEVQHFSEFFFHGEEISISARAYTHGYDLYHPHRIICWHEYTRKNRTKVWDDHTQKFKEAGKTDMHWVERNDHCHKLNRILFGMDGEDPKSYDFGKYGFGTERTLEEYERYAGLSFKKRAVHKDTMDKLYPVYPVPEKSQCEWESELCGSHDIRICVHVNDLKYTDEKGRKLLANDYDFWYVGAHDAEGKEIYRKDLVQPDINKYLKSKNEWVDYRFIFLTNGQPVTYTIWTHSKSKGWLTKVDRPVN